MEVSSVNDVKIYNLSAGKSLPEWMGSKARRKLQQKNSDIRHRIQLIQDFEMPDISQSICVTPDGRYLWASGSYKPWIKCFDLNNLSIKFERGLDSDVIKMIPLSDDYSKVVILEEERWIEFHALLGRFHRMRMPKFGRDMVLSEESSDLFLVGASKEIYRLNLEQGQWLTPFESTGTSLNCCQIGKEHQLFICGSTNGVVEGWDHRDKSLCGTLDCGAYIRNMLGENINIGITALDFSDPLHIGVGTSTGHVLLYDIRSRRPLLVKDHNNELPIKKIEFIKREDGNVVASMDKRMMKIWHESDGSPMSAIENKHDLNDFCRYPKSGMIFFANEAPKMLQYFIPKLGPAPKWCSYLENLTEEMEETEPTVYDNYRFVTKKQLDDLGLSGLIGTNVLRAYMHGYFIDSRLYNKAQTATQPFAYEKFKENKVKEMVEEERELSAIKAKKEKIPVVNKALAARLREEASMAEKKAENKKEKRLSKKASLAANVLGDDRFKKLFESEDFEVDETSETYIRGARMAEKMKEKEPVQVEDDGSGSDEEEEDDGNNEMGDKPAWEEERFEDDMASDMESDESSDHDADETLKRQRAKRRAQRRADLLKYKKERFLEKQTEKQKKLEERKTSKPTKFVLHTLSKDETTRRFVDETVAGKSNTNLESLALGHRKIVSERNKKSGTVNEDDAPFGAREMTFTIDKRKKDLKALEAKNRQDAHVEERKALLRKPNQIVTKGLKKLPGNLNIGKRKGQQMH